MGSEAPVYRHGFPTPFGRMTVIWGWRGPRPRVHRILLPNSTQKRPGCSTGLRDGTCPAVSALAGKISRFLAGRPVRFDLAILSLGRCRPFQQKVLLAEYGIPRGRVSTYGRIARRIGRPGASRAVGNALAQNPFPIAIPCHRALRSDLSLGGYQGGLAMKRRLLEMEGVRFGPDGRAINPSVQY